MYNFKIIFALSSSYISLFLLSCLTLTKHSSPSLGKILASPAFLLVVDVEKPSNTKRIWSHLTQSFSPSPTPLPSLDLSQAHKPESGESQGDGAWGALGFFLPSSVLWYSLVAVYSSSLVQLVQEVVRGLEWGWSLGRETFWVPMSEDLLSFNLFLENAFIVVSLSYHTLTTSVQLEASNAHIALQKDGLVKSSRRWSKFSSF